MYSDFPFKMNTVPPRVLAELNRLLDWASTELDKVDRNVLGSFALGRESLVAKYAFEFALVYGRPIRDLSYPMIEDRLVISDEGLSRGEVHQVVDRMLGHVNWVLIDEEVSLNDFVAEAWLWNCVINDIDFNDVATANISGSARERFALLLRIYNNPTHLPFFEVGIWDEDFITYCLATGVDASLASPLVKSDLVEA